MTKLSTRHTQAEIERALFALVLADDRPSKAVERLEAAGQSVPLRTLQEWRNAHADTYERLKAERAQRVQLHMAEQCESLAAGYAEVEYQMISRALSGEGNPNSHMAGARNAAISKGVNMDKASQYRGRPTHVVEHRDMAQLLKTLERKFSHVVQVNPDLIEAGVDEASSSNGELIEAESEDEQGPSGSSVDKASGSFVQSGVDTASGSDGAA